MVVNASSSSAQDILQPGLADREAADHLAERHLVHRMIIGMLILVPVGAALFALLVGIAAWDAGTGVAGPIAMGAGAGVLAGVFFGTWSGFVASVKEFEDLEHR